jgi:hypothetical protein
MLGNYPEQNREGSGFYQESSFRTSNQEKLGLNRKTLLIGTENIFKII